MSDDQYWGLSGYKYSSVHLVFRYWWVGVAISLAWGAALLDVDWFAYVLSVVAIPMRYFLPRIWAKRQSASKQQPWARAKSFKNPWTFEKSSKQRFRRLVLQPLYLSAVVVEVMLAVFNVVVMLAVFNAPRFGENTTIGKTVIVETISVYFPPAIAFFAVLALTSAVRMRKIMKLPTQTKFNKARTVEKDVPLVRPILAVTIDGLIMTGPFVCLVLAASILGWNLNEGWCWAGAALAVFGYQWWAGCRGRSVGHMLGRARLRPELGRPSRISARRNAWRAVLIVVELAVLLFTCVWITRFQLAHPSGPPLMMAYGLTVAVLLVPLHPRGGHPHNIAGHVSVEWLGAPEPTSFWTH